MIIYEATNRRQKRFKKTDISWEDLAKRCSQTVRTKETVEEFRKMDKDQQSQIKDVGGFVAGKLKNGSRKTENVESRCCLAYDLDDATPDFWDKLTMFNDYKCFMYSTHKHTPEHPRYRLLIHLSREVTSEEYEPVSRMVATDIGMEMMDDCSHEPARMMYWPSTSVDGEFVFESQDGSSLDPDDVLARYKDWHDTSQWPGASDQRAKQNNASLRRTDPTEKEGIIGAFCRVYDIHSAIDTFLSDVYKPSSVEGRYDYIPADSSAGLVIYDNKYAYSHHSSDPACGVCLNAFDLVRIHKFGDLDQKSPVGTASSKLPSFKAMWDLALKDENVRLQLAKDRAALARVEFDCGEGSEEGWQAGLELDKHGDVKATLNNFVLIIRHDSKLKSICYNEHRGGICIRNKDTLPWLQLKPGWNDPDMSALASYIDNVYHIFSLQKLKAAVLTVTAERSYHPIKDFLQSLPEWDGTERLDTLFVDYLGAEDNAYVRAVTRKTFVAAVARIYEPGIKFDQILVSVGKQGIGKSTLFSRLGGVYYSDSLNISDMRDKTAPEKLQGYWIIEISEMNGIRKVDAETVKSFASRQDDKYRAAYGMTVENHPRQCIIVGTTNSTQGFLRDISGNRRFWPVDVYGNNRLHPWDLSQETIDQVWAEALYRYREGEELILTGEAADMALAKQQSAMESDDREGLVRKYLDTMLPKDWNSMSISDRRMYLSEDGFITKSHPPVVKRDKVCNMEIWAECLGKDIAGMRKQDSYELSAIMSKIEGWEKYNENASGKLSFGVYGTQIAYVRKGDSSNEVDEFFSE